jgi:hypothetical protein
MLGYTLGLHMLPILGAIRPHRSSSKTLRKRWRRESNPCARLCRPLPHHSATPPRGLMRLHLRADDGIRTRDPHLGKVMRYQLRYIRASRTRCRHVRTETIVHPSMAAQISLRFLSSFRSSRSHSVFWPKPPPVLLFDVVRPPAPGWARGPVAQWESVRFTRGRSLVRSQPGPQASMQLKTCI